MIIIWYNTALGDDVAATAKTLWLFAIDYNLVISLLDILLQILEFVLEFLGSSLDLVSNLGYKVVNLLLVDREFAVAIYDIDTLCLRSRGKSEDQRCSDKIKKTFHCISVLLVLYVKKVE